MTANPATNPTDLVADKRAALDGLRAIVDSSPASLGRAIAGIYHADAEWRGAHPLNELRGVDAIENSVWRPLLNAMPDLERRDAIFIGGDWEGARYIGAVTGHWPLAPSLGAAEMWPGPVTADGMVLAPQDPQQSAASIKLVLGMHETINSYDDNLDNSRDGLLNMRQKDFWHPKMMWYGPAGIGAARGLEGYVDAHQLPFRRAFPNRVAVGHYVRFGDGKYAATGGWPSVQARHTGGNWLGLPPSGREVRLSAAVIAGVFHRRREDLFPYRDFVE